ncbi:MAG: PhzF family phenazine biosynthesis protein [Terriglobus sp.]
MSNGSIEHRSLQWAQVDVFAEAAFQGNGLAVFADGSTLTTEQMQLLARETNLSETTFILPADPEVEVREGVRVRIFTPQEELPFAGHPTLGTASWIRENLPHFRNADALILKLNVGPIPVTFHGSNGESVYAEMRQRDPEFGGFHDPAAILDACGLTVDDLHPTLRAETVSTGINDVILPLASVEALGRMRVRPDALDAATQAAGAKFTYIIAPAGENTWRTRMPFLGTEDPATGSAAGCCISYLVKHGAVASGQQAVLLQGQEVFRPSRLDVRASLLEGRVTDVYVAGRTFFVATGRFTHP